MPRIALRGLMLGMCVAAACGNGDDDTPGGPDGGGNVIDASGVQADAFVPPAGSFTVQWGPVTVPPGQEDTRCAWVKLKNPGQIHVNQIHNVLSGGSHHFIVYRQSSGDEKLTPEPCQPFAGTLNPTQGAPMMITQVEDETLTLPAGVGFTLAMDQLIRLEMHFINTTDADLEVKGTSTFIPMADAAFQNEADFLFAGHVAFSVPPGTSTVNGFIKMPAEFSDAKFFGMTGHTHQLGTNVRVWSATDQNDTSKPVYDVAGYQWDSPEVKHYAPEFTLPANGGFRFSCDFNNPTNTTVNFGESANQEMCFFWGYYYPSKAPKVCATIGALSTCCPGGSPQLCNALGG